MLISKLFFFSAIICSVQMQVTFKNVTLGTSASEKFAIISSSGRLKENLPENFISSLVITGKIPVLYEDSVTDIENVREIYFHRNEVGEIRIGALKNLKSVKIFVINCGNLTTIPAEVFDNLTLEQLQISFNLVKSVSPEAFKNLTTLKRLSLWHNQLESLADGSFDYLENLEILDLSENSIEKFSPDIFKNLINLKMVLLKNNQFAQIPLESFSNLNIYYLDLSGNKISTLPKNLLERLPTLTEVNLSYNKLSTISDNIFSNSKLYQVELSYNEISHIEAKAFQNMTNLANVMLSGNLLTKYNPEWFGNSPEIYRLFLSNNLIEEIPDEAFMNLRNEKGQWIKIDSNKIRNISFRAFKGLKRLDYLNLSFNKIEEWNADLLKDIEEVKYLNMMHNKMKCPIGDFDQIFKAKYNYFADNPLTVDCLQKITNWKNQNTKKFICTEAPCSFS